MRILSLLNNKVSEFDKSSFSYFIFNAKSLKNFDVKKS